MEYSLNLTGAANYSISAWPMHWSYESISPLPNSSSIDANRWVNFTGSPTETYTVKWIANGLYPNVIWKDDSFLDAWSFTGRTTLTSHSFTSDGDILTDSVSGRANDWGNYQKTLPSLTNSAYLLVRVKGDTNSKFMIQIWEDINMGWEGRVFVSNWITPSEDYVTQVFPLSSGATLTLVWLTVMTTDGNPTTIYVDYIMIA
jgi:hypothetical protein